MSIKLQNAENIVYIARRHGLVYFWWWFLIFILFTAPFFFMFWLFNHGWWGQSLFFLSLAIGLFVLIRALFLWRKNAAIITTHRIIDIDQRGFFDQLVTEISYDKLDYAVGHIKGFFGTIWRYGELMIQNENGNMKIVLNKIKQPVRLQQKINELRKKFNTKKDSMCLECEEKNNGLFEAMEKKIFNLEITELIKLKRSLDKKITEVLGTENDN